MRQVYRFTYKGEHLPRLFGLCKVSRCLYNQALYAFRQELKENNKWLFYKELEKLMKTTSNLEGEINYRLLKAQCAQQCLKGLDSSIRSYLKSIKDWKIHKEKYHGMPKLPGYNKGIYKELVFTNQNSRIRDGFLHLYKEIFLPIPQWKKYEERLKHFQLARIVPLNDKVIEIQLVYERELPKKIGGNKTASIDIGVNNLATMVTSEGNALIFNGRPLKSVNQLANKRLAKAKSELALANGKRKSKKTNAILAKRGRRINDMLHKVSRKIVNILTGQGIGTLAVGYNKRWKQESNLGKKTNQAFVQIPFDKFIGMLEYKCALAGIDFVTTEESYTSKCDALAFEPIGKHETYLGKRVKRGLFQSSIGRLVNADVNGALNIMRKVIGDSPIQGIIDRGLLLNPAKCVA